MNAWRRKIGTEGNDNKIALSQDKSNRGEQKREVALPPRVGKDSVYCARSARCTTRRIRSVTSAHAGETVSRPCHSCGVMCVPDRTVQDRPFPNWVR